MSAPNASPWGKVESCLELAPGIYDVSTASHGGLYVERKFPSFITAIFGSKRWWEEDSEWTIPWVLWEKEIEQFADGDSLLTWRYERNAPHAQRMLRHWDEGLCEKILQWVKENQDDRSIS